MPGLNDVELAALDLIIAIKKSGAAPVNFLNANLSVNNIGDVAAAAASVVAVAGLVGLSAPYTAAGSSSVTPGAELTLDELLEIRANAVNAQNP